MAVAGDAEVLAKIQTRQTMTIITARLQNRAKADAAVLLVKLAPEEESLKFLWMLHLAKFSISLAALVALEVKARQKPQKKLMVSPVHPPPLAYTLLIMDGCTLTVTLKPKLALHFLLPAQTAMMVVLAAVVTTPSMTTTRERICAVKTVNLLLVMLADKVRGFTTTAVMIEETLPSITVVAVAVPRMVLQAETRRVEHMALILLMAALAQKVLPVFRVPIRDKAAELDTEVVAAAVLA